MQGTHLRQLEDVLLAVYDLQPAARQPGTHIAGVEPAISIQDLCRLALILVVALEHRRPTHADLYAVNTASAHHLLELTCDALSSLKVSSWTSVIYWAHLHDTCAGLKLRAQQPRSSTQMWVPGSGHTQMLAKCKKHAGHGTSPRG